MFNLKDFATNELEEIKIEEESVSMDKNTWYGTSFELIKAAVKFKVVKLTLFGAFMGLFFLATGDFNKSKNMAEEASLKGARDDYFGLASFFAKETGHKSTKLNIHPFYHTKGVRELEQKYFIDFGREQKFTKVFAYVKYEDQDFIVMKKAARGKGNERISLDDSTFFTMSADDFCEDYFDGFLPGEDMEKVFVKTWRVSGIKNKEGQNRFRCVIGPDTINSFIEDDEE